MLALNVHPLDDDLRTAVTSVAVALPLLVISAALAFLRVGLVVAYFMFTLGFLALEYAVYFVLHHLDSVAGSAFTITCLISNLTFLLIGNRYLARHRQGPGD